MYLLRIDLDDLGDAEMTGLANVVITEVNDELPTDPSAELLSKPEGWTTIMLLLLLLKSQK